MIEKGNKAALYLDDPLVNRSRQQKALWYIYHWNFNNSLLSNVANGNSSDLRNLPGSTLFCTGDVTTRI